tara:strand:- start:691 stop:1464 length:774 start_codon:yes stop_codon:yes gene_type:complete
MEEEEKRYSIDPAQTLAALATGGLVVGMDPLRKFLAKGRGYNKNNPNPTPAAPAEEALSQEVVRRINEIKPGYTRADFRVVKPDEGIKIGIPAASANAANLKVDRAKVKPDSIYKDVKNIISVNPYTGRETLAHELGHSVMQTGRVRDFNHALKQRLRAGGPNIEAAKIAAPIIGSMLVPGSDDLATAMALSYALHAPLLIDEAGASLEGLGLLKRAGMPANSSQKARLAGALLSYMVKPTLLGLAGSQIGNLVDKP